MGSVKEDRVVVSHRVTQGKFTDEVKGSLEKTVCGREQQDHRL